ncbi:MAG: IS21-like element helper ATPase IstB, partial [Chloroflexi bacterium]|nr:IS21-like element helper ATPase IstB [Chloroflexota bacterium]
MNTEISIFKENCRYLGLKNLQEQYETLIEKANTSDVGFYEFLYEVVQSEANSRRERSIRYRIHESKLPQPCKLLADFDFSFQPKLKKKLIMDLATMEFIRHKESVLFIGDCGTGKSHLARSLALIACEKGNKVFYTSCAGMLNDLNTGVYEKTLIKRMRKYINPDLLVIDEMGHDRLELEVTKEAHLLFKVIDERYKLNKPLIFTTNVDEADWADYLGDPISTKAILDRIFHH